MAKKLWQAINLKSALNFDKRIINLRILRIENGISKKRIKEKILLKKRIYGYLFSIILSCINYPIDMSLNSNNLIK